MAACSSRSMASLLDAVSTIIERELGDRWGIAWTLQHLVLLRYLQDGLETAEELGEESRSLWTEVGDRRNLADTLVVLGVGGSGRGEDGGGEAACLPSVDEHTRGC